jgi:hypothetical protein
MARKPPPTYANMTLAPTVAPVAILSFPSQSAGLENASRQQQEGRRTLKEASAHLMLYVHPDAAKALKRYAVDQNAKVHDLLLEAVEDWFKRHGLREAVRADTGRVPRTRSEGPLPDTGI